MRLLKIMLVSSAVLLGTTASGYALAGGGHFGGSHFRGGFVGGSHVGAGRFVGGHVGPGRFVGGRHFGASRFVDGRVIHFAPRFRRHFVVVPRTRFAIIASVPLFVPRYYYPPHAYPAPMAPSYWYYCASAGAYYPYVQACPEGWQRVIPQGTAPY